MKGRGGPERDAGQAQSVVCLARNGGQPDRLQAGRAPRGLGRNVEVARVDTKAEPETELVRSVQHAANAERQRLRAAVVAGVDDIAAVARTERHAEAGVQDEARWMPRTPQWRARIAFELRDNHLALPLVEAKLARHRQKAFRRDFDLVTAGTQLT